MTTPTRPEAALTLAREALEEFTQYFTSGNDVPVRHICLARDSSTAQKLFKAYEALTPPASPGGWQPIDTAPKPDKGKEIVLLLFSCGGIATGYYDAYYAEGGRGFEEGDGWIDPIGGEELFRYFSGYPTHWQPLPTPPEANHEQS